MSQQITANSDGNTSISWSRSYSSFRDSSTASDELGEGVGVLSGSSVGFGASSSVEDEGEGVADALSVGVADALLVVPADSAVMRSGELLVICAGGTLNWSFTPCL